MTYRKTVLLCPNVSVNIFVFVSDVMIRIDKKYKGLWEKKGYDYDRYCRLIQIVYQQEKKGIL